jgi:hypothetical protein
MAATKDELIKELLFYSDKLSERSRVVSGGVIATWWALLVSDKTPAKLTPTLFVFPVMCAALCILVDFLQYIVSYLHSLAALKSLEKQGGATFSYNTKTPAYKARAGLFYIKLILALTSISWFCVLLARALLR